MHLLFLIVRVCRGFMSKKMPGTIITLMNKWMAVSARKEHIILIVGLINLPYASHILQEKLDSHLEGVKKANEKREFKEVTISQATKLMKQLTQRMG